MMNMNDIAVLYFADDFVQALTNMLLTTFKTTPLTIEQYVMTNKNNVMDTDEDASFEYACGVYVIGINSTGLCEHYNLMSCARTGLVIVCVNEYLDPPLLTDDIGLTDWGVNEMELSAKMKAFQAMRLLCLNTH